MFCDFINFPIFNPFYKISYRRDSYDALNTANPKIDSISPTLVGLLNKLCNCSVMVRTIYN